MNERTGASVSLIAIIACVVAIAVAFVAGSYVALGKFPIRISMDGSLEPSTTDMKPLTNNQIRSICSKDIQDRVADVGIAALKRKGMTDKSFVDTLNIAYRLCLTKYGVEPEDLL